MQMRVDVRRLSGLVIVVLLAAVALAACASTPSVPSPQPLPEGKNFTGLWYSPQFEHMYLVQSGDVVRGVYAYREGGQLEGTVSGNVLTFRWHDPGSREHARRAMLGQGYLQLIVDEEGQARLVGEWGYGDNKTGAGPWEAEFVRELDPDDPLTIEAIRQVHH